MERAGRRRYRARTPDDNLLATIDHYDNQPLPTELDKPAHLKRLEILRDRALLHTLFATAGRVSEVLSLNRKDVASGSRARAEIMGKGSKIRTLFFSAEAMQAIRAYIAERDLDEHGHATVDPYPALFISHRKLAGNRLTPQSAWNVVKRGALAAGIKGAASPHMFRHLQATDLINAGAPMESVQKMLGHESPETTMTVYAHLKDDTIESDVETFRRPVRRRERPT